MKTVLVTTYYNEKVKERNDELLTCIRANVSNKNIERILILIEEDTIIPFKHSKIVWMKQNSRPVFGDFIKAANDYPQDIKIIANTDIYFDEYNIGLICASLKDGQCFALSRWDIQLSGDYIHHASRDSQDSWIFKGKIKDMNANFLTGKAGIDNRMAYEIEQAGYEVLNPSRSIYSFHLHITGIRNYTRKEGEVIDKPYKLVPPTYIGERMRTDMKIDKYGNEIKVPIEYKETHLTEFSYDKQKKQMSDMLSEGNVPKRFLLSICIPSLRSRRELYKELRTELLRQISKYRLASKVEILDEIDNGYAPIGWKRNLLNIRSKAHYVAHLDDDDKISEDYLYELVKAIEGNFGVDVVTFNAIVTYNGAKESLMLFNRKYKTNHEFEGENGYYWERMPCHLNAIRRECALEHAFHVINKKGANNRRERSDNGSDVHYSLDMVRDETLKSDYHIDKVLYYYLYKTKS